MIWSSQITKTVELLGITALQSRVEEKSLSLLFFDQNYKKAINRCFQKLFFSESYILEENFKQTCFAFPKTTKNRSSEFFKRNVLFIHVFGYGKCNNRGSQMNK